MKNRFTVIVSFRDRDPMHYTTGTKREAQQFRKYYLVIDRWHRLGITSIEVVTHEIKEPVIN